jgi:mono/diheme cytochrome c family protein
MLPRSLASVLLASLLMPAGGMAQETSRQPIASRQGWSDAERRDFYHLSLGGEIFPLAWTQALESPTASRPFLEGVVRFGFLDDPRDPDHLPIGLTAAVAKAGTSARMLGINCSACHVGELTHGGRTYRVDGAPNVLMDIIAFNTDLTKSVGRIADNPGDFAAFQLRVVGSPEEAARLKALRPEVLKVLQALALWDQKDGAHQMADALATALTPMFQPKTSSWPLAGSIMVMPPLDQPVTLEFLSPLQAIGEEAGPVIGAFLKANSGTGAPLGVLDSDPLAAAQKLETLTTQVVQHFVQTIWYLKQASALMTKQDQLRNLPGGTTSGPGRVDDFRLARNLVVGNPLMAKPPTSPTSYPTLWGSNRVKWLGWDGNANSTMQRNIGTALAIGAVFDPESGTSSIPLDRVYRLEVIASKVDPPKWPFGSIDPANAARGAKLYQNLCAKCHVDPDTVPSSPSGTLPDWLPDLLYDPAPGDGSGVAKGPSDPDKVVATDPNRAVNFAQDMVSPPGIPNPVESLAILQKVLYVADNISPWQAKRLLGDRDETWRATGKYAGRPLTATWAAAPYLHNDSVPTLYDLLQPVAKRPATFRRGGRRFDPVKVGYLEPGPGEAGFLFDTTKSGNRNIGHEYGTDLGEDDRTALIEYLKTK